ncbi:exopolyphosphatase PRUNE1 [Huso huso]|uniref:Exopolyphosphatase PRUNE1 n=1 Tax=Huso huso TaxID=61971 RepID=A0ABR0YFG0_HUSHU
MQARSKLLRSMDTFLRSCSAALKRSEEEGSAVHIVLGNEACDLDSMVSAITFAYFLAKTSAKTPKTLIPVLNIPRSELPLRTEGTYFLRENGIAEESLVLRDEVDLHALHRAGQLLLTLVDHNVLPGADSVLEGAVVEVVDHRPLERAPSAGCAVTSEPVGSCATLIAERIARSAPHVLDKQVAALLYGTIVLDCVNMAPEAGKVTPKDRELVALLESKFTNLPQRATLFESLQKAKFNVAGLSTEQMLQKDMKAVGGDDVTVAISGVYMRLEAFLQRSGLQQELCEFCHKHRHAALVAMTISFSDGNQPYRQIAVYSYSTRLREQLCQALENSQNPHLNLSTITSPYPHIKAYHQGNTLASRKKVLPIIKEFLRERERVVHAGTDGEELEDQFDSSCRTPPLEEEARHHRYSASRRRRQAAEDSGTEEDSQLPPTPMNSLVEGCPLDNGLPRLTADAIMEKFSRMAKEEENWGERDLPSGQ